MAKRAERWRVVERLWVVSVAWASDAVGRVRRAGMDWVDVV